MSRRELPGATYQDAIGTWPARAWLEDGRYRAVIHGFLFDGGFDIFEPALRPEVMPKAPQPERTPGGHAAWRPSVVELRRTGDRYEAHTPYGDHRGLARIIHEAER